MLKFISWWVIDFFLTQLLKGMLVPSDLQQSIPDDLLQAMLKGGHTGLGGSNL